MENFHIIKDGNKIRSISNLTKDIFCITFKENDIVIYKVFLQQYGTTSIPCELYDKYNPEMTYINCSTPEDKKMSTEIVNYTEMFKPTTETNYQRGKSTVLAIGQFDDKDGIFIEWLSTGRIVVRVNGKDYKQTIEEFINNCK